MYLKMEYSYSAMLFFLCFAVPIIFSEVIATSPRNSPSLNSQNQSCTTSNKKSGICVSVFQCKKYFDIYKRVWGEKASDKDKQLLKSAHCGSRPLDQRVCCEKSAVSEMPEKNKNKPCGQSIIKNTAYIIGGKNSTLGAWPWMAVLYQLNISTGITKFHCGGSLIASDWVLTAAHCLPENENVKLVHVRLGELDINDKVDDKANPIEVKVKNFRMHPNYTNTTTSLNDIALVQLEEPVAFFDYISPICLHKGKQYATNETYYDQKQLTLAGWGKTNASRERTITHLLEVPLNTVPLKKCKEIHRKVDKSVICCDASKKASCSGDSGGPLMLIGEGSRWSQCGIVSYGYYECVKENNPTVYTKVTTFIDWIEKETGLKF